MTARFPSLSAAPETGPAYRQTFPLTGPDGSAGTAMTDQLNCHATAPHPAGAPPTLDEQQRPFDAVIADVEDTLTWTTRQPNF